jgi:hypothetical protein
MYCLLPIITKRELMFNMFNGHYGDGTTQSAMQTRYGLVFYLLRTL